MTPRLATDQQQRDIIRADLETSLIVEAAAGTGKTTELVNRIVAVLRTGRANVDQIVAVTFTHKAAGELKVRLRQELDEARQAASGDDLRYLEEALKHLEEAAIGTIHSFCAQILRERPVEADVDPAFQDLPEQEQRRMFERAFERWFAVALEESRPGVRRAVTRLAWNPGRLTPAEELQMSAKKLNEWRDFRTPWRREPFDRETELTQLASVVTGLAELSWKCTRPKDDLFKATQPIRELATWLERSGFAGNPDYDTLEGLLLKLLGDTSGYVRKGKGEYAPNVKREDVANYREALREQLQKFKQRADADLAALLQAEMQDLIDGYDDLKRRAGKLDFVDLLIKTRDLVRGNASVRAFLQRRFTHLFIDEFQDTDPLQAEMLILLASADPAVDDWRAAAPSPGKFFAVGDPKQSIYKFRRADVAFYQDICRHLEGHGVRIVQLGTSFRSFRPIQSCVNAAFEPEMRGDTETAQAGYVSLLGDLKPIEGQPPVVVIPAPRPWGARDITKKAIDQCLPDAICAWVEWLLRESGWKVRDPDRPAELMPVEARHVAVLFRRFVNFGIDLTRPYIRSLEARDIPHLLVGSKSFHQREEIETLRAACAAIEWPDDELAVYATLRGSLFAIPDPLLLRYKTARGRINPVAPADDAAEFATLVEALKTLGDLHRNRNRRPVAETVNLLLESTRAHMGFALRPGGHQVLSNVLRISELARGFEASGGISFRGFVEELTDRADRTDASEAPMMEPAADGVRLLTVHTAKGLEFPIVILADMTANLSSREADRHIDPGRRLCATRLMACTPWDLIDREREEKAREEAEGVRVAYVAATRARDMLVLPGVGDKELDNWWLSPLNKAIYPPPADYRKSRSFGGFGAATVLERPDYHGDEPSVKPGWVKPQCGDDEVLWWDPSKLRLNTNAGAGIRDYDILAGGDRESADRYEEWRSRRSERAEAGAALEWQIVTPSEASGAAPEAVVEVVPAAPLGERPGGARFGTLVHMVLRDAGFNASVVERLADAHGRALGAHAGEVRSAAEACLTALGHPLMDRARAASPCFRELPVTLKLAARQVVEGSIDLAFLERGEWQIVDFKTDAHVGSRRSRYERQLRWYAAALTGVTGQPARCYLLSI